jgi:cellulose synthase operon protein C
LYMRSIQGGEIDPKTQRPILWGWQGIATRTANQPQFRAVFHEARYNLAVSLQSLALAKAGSERQKYLEMSGRTIRQTQQLFGTGEEWETWKPRYDTLLKNIQRALGQKTVGLDAPAVARTD